MNREDKQDILEAIARYSHTIDSGDTEGWADVFSDDGVFEIYNPGETAAAVRAEGGDALKGFMKGVIDSIGDGQVRHFQTGTIFLDSTDGVIKTRTMLSATLRAPGTNDLSLVQTGIYDDTWQRTAGGWKLKHRAFHGDTPTG